MYNPVSTYRIQFNKDFTFRNFSDHLEYFKLLGIGTVYASPVFSATPGSMHGYDVTNSQMFNPEIGNVEEFERIVNRLREMKIGWLQDVVPNHMAMHYSNIWLRDVLEKGRKSEFASFFDIDFDHPDFKGKVMLPFLGKKSEDVIDDGEISFSYKDGKPVFVYFGSIFPVNEKSLMAGFEKENLKELLAIQNYELTFWKDVDQHLNYRRFFTISSLLCLQMQDDNVFQKYHSLIGEMVRKNNFQGLRIDHIDGLMKPSDYIEKLRLLTGEETYIVAEKILGNSEDLPGQWPLQGTTGYDFLAIINNLITYKNLYGELLAFYNQLTGFDSNAEEIIYRKKKSILSRSMQGDLDNLGRLFIKSGLITADDPEVTSESVRDAIGEFLLACPRYKLYSESFPLTDEETEIVETMIATAGQRAPSLLKPIGLLRELFLENDRFEAEKKQRAIEFFMRCMQFTGPLIAKGQEDTAMYDYNCFIAHNEVGDRIDASGITKTEFHELMTKRLRTMPLSMNATSTHDTKRGEDVRARLAVLSELASLWIKNVNHWILLNKPVKIQINGKVVPNANEEYFIYQTLMGVMPFSPDTGFLTRINEYIVKALREAKVNSNWEDPDVDYENAVTEFLGKCLAPDSVFLNSFRPIQQKVALYGILNSLIQVTLKATCPGIPDFYQGSELWDLSMVDPDNRRPVNYSQREELLRKLIEDNAKDPVGLVENLYARREDGAIKMWFTHVLMLERNSNPDLFAYGEYIPLATAGRYKEHVMAFARNYKNEWFIIAIPLFIAFLNDKLDSLSIPWGDTLIELPELAPDNWHSVIDQEDITTDGFIHVSDIMKLTIPCVLRGHNAENNRRAGILMHISSLPGAYGIGDTGPEAYKFIDFMHASGQAYWQILPVNPVSEVSAYSPYSTYSGFAGNLMLIDPGWLLKYNLITQKDLLSTDFNISDLSDFEKAGKFRNDILDKAFSNYKRMPKPYLKSKFEAFCKKEDFWLEDYALYLILKDELGQPWHSWPPKLRDRHPGELSHYSMKFSGELEKQKFFQFIFSCQWQDLKKYANINDVRIIGDMSFYVSYESVDVWQHPEAFKLDKDKKMIGVGGAPPDYFSETGQLWNMPVYNWEFLKKDGYTWWKNRVRRNLEWFDLLRFDHFRGFSGYWEVPAGATDAVNGKWMEAPGNDFFNHLKKEFPDMPFIAEDLGDIDDKVYELRDTFKLPGMRVLQFAFNNSAERSIHLPHNYSTNSVVYTGTHDNNTTRGWYEQELSTKYRIRVDEYTNKKLNGSTISEELIRLAYSSVALIAIIPLQDILGLGQSERLNNPSGSTENWKWKLRSLERIIDKGMVLQRLVKLFWRS